MAATCPNCGVPLPSTRDAFCSECRCELNWSAGEPVAEPSTLVQAASFRELLGRAPAQNFSLFARLVFETTFIGICFCLCWAEDHLSLGPYPVILLFFLTVLGCWLARWIAFKTLRNYGVPIYRVNNGSR